LNDGGTPSALRSYVAGKSATDTLPRIGFVLLAVLSLLWGFGWPILKIVLREIPPWTFRTICLILGGPIVIALAKAKGLRIAIPKAEFWPLLLVTLLNITGYFICSAYGIFYMKAGRAAIIAYTMPVWASILGIFILGERLGRASLAGLCLGIGGLTILIGPDIKAIGSAPLGSVFMLGAAISWAGGTVFMKYFRWTMPIIVLIGWQLILGGIPIIIGTLIFEPITAILQLSWRGALGMAYIILLGMIFSYWIWFKVIELFPAHVASIGTLAIPIIGVFSSALILGEKVGFQEIAALILVVMALAIILIKPKGF